MEEDSHMCLHCKEIIVGLEQYVEHRKRGSQAGRKCQGLPNNPQSPSRLGGESNKVEPSSSPSAVENVVVEDESALLMARLTSSVEPDPSHMPSEGDFFQSLQLTARPQPTTVADIREDPNSRLEDLSFFESIGLYWVNPADRTDRASEEPTGESRKAPVDEIDSNVVGQCLTEEVQMGDFLHELGLAPVSESSRRWRLWQPNGVEDLVGELLPQLYLPNTETTDPTLMEDRTQCLLQPKPNQIVTGVNPPDQVHAGDLYCKDCQRSLATPELYARHKLTELHAKHAGTNNGDSLHKRAIKKPKFFDDQSMDTCPRSLPSNEDPEKSQRNLSRTTHQSSTDERLALRNCPTCEARVLPRQMGKHLVSHFHYHRSLGHPAAQDLVLQHITAVVHQSPFQCQACHFYCNWHKDLVEHVSQHQERRGPFLCQMCERIFSTHDQLVDHLSCHSHTELVSILNRSVPVIIRQLDMVPCTECDATFRFNFTLRHHMVQVHGRTSFELADHPKYRCQSCSYFTFKKFSLKMHQFLVHPNPQLRYECRPCRRQFPSKESVMRHRSTGLHRDTVALVQGEQIEARACTHCGERVVGLAKLEEHVASEHRLLLPQCHLCGVTFHFPQQLPPHLKLACHAKDPGVGLGICSDGSFKCTLCNFTSHQELLLTLHSKYVHMHSSVELDERDRSCPVCSKVLPRKRLKAHLRSHNTSKLKCQFCDKTFEIQKLLIDHTKLYHANAELHSCKKCPYQNAKRSLLNLHIKRQHVSHPSNNEKCFPCQTCGVKFKVKSSLIKHRKTHAAETQQSFTCSQPDCGFKALFKSDLDRHMLKHSDVKDLSCSECEFKCKRKSDLSRHKRLSHENLPFLQCGLCSYKTKNSAHIKRHSKVHQQWTSFEIQVDENDVMIGP